MVFSAAGTLFHIIKKKDCPQKGPLSAVVSDYWLYLDRKMLNGKVSFRLRAQCRENQIPPSLGNL